MHSVALAVNHDTKEFAITVRVLETSHFQNEGPNTWVDPEYPNKKFNVVIKADRTRAEFIAHSQSFLLQSNGYTPVTVKGNFNE